MENIFIASISLLLVTLAIFLLIGKTWGTSIWEFLFANRSLSLLTSGTAISSHWIWAIALFLGPVATYNWGILGLIWFILFNALSLLVLGFLVGKIRDRYPEGFSLTSYIKENFGRRISLLYQFEFVVIGFAALLLAFTAIGKLWSVTSLTSVISPEYAGLIIGLITLAFTMKGGIRTSIFTGTFQTVCWLIFFSAGAYLMWLSGLPVLSLGKNNLNSVFDANFLTTFAGAYAITILVSSSGHGHLWQKAFSMPRKNIMPSFTIGAVIFAAIMSVLLSLSMFAFSNNLDVVTPDVSALTAIKTVMGTTSLAIFGVLFIGQTSTVIDSSMNYISSLITIEWLKQESVWISRAVMLVFILTAWLISFAKLDIWFIMMLMGSVRTVMFVPLLLHVLGIKLKNSVIFYVSLITIFICYVLSLVAKFDKLPIFDLYSSLIALILPLVLFKLATKNH